VGLTKKKPKPASAPAAAAKKAPAGPPTGPGNAAVASYFLPNAVSAAAPAKAKKPGAMSSVAQFFGRGKKKATPDTSQQFADAATDTKVAAERAEIDETYAWEVQDWIGRNGDASAAPAINEKTGMSFASEADGHAREAAGRILGAQSMDERTNGMLFPQEAQADPFFYDTKKLSQKELDALRRQGLTDSELTAIALYSGQAAYPMNQVLRGLITDPATIKAYLPWCLHLERALAKLPDTARNLMKGQDGAKLDANQSDDAQVPIQTVYRNDEWSNAFAARFHSFIRQGGTLPEPGFLSTTVKRGAYNLDPNSKSPVSRTIDVSDSSAGKSVIDLSSNKGENEVLFPPGTSMQITSIKDEKGQSVPNPSAVYTPEELQKHGFDIEAKIVGSPKKDAGKGAPPAADPESLEAAEEADGAVIGGILAQTDAAAKKDKP
jgi:hypothetical protein